MNTVGHMKTKQLNALLASFPKEAKIERTESTVTVSTPDGRKALSAVSPDGRNWHVMAVAGLVDRI